MTNDASSTVRLRSSSQHVPDVFFKRLFTDRSLPTLFTSAAPAGLKPTPAGRLQETYSHLYYSSTVFVSVFVAHIPPSPSFASCLRRHTVVRNNNRQMSTYNCPVRLFSWFNDQETYNQAVSRLPSSRHVISRDLAS